jgi:hypothetical protein
VLIDQLLLQTPAKEDADQFIFIQMAYMRRMGIRRNLWVSL